MKIEEFLNQYDIYHSSIILGDKVHLSVSYRPTGDIKIAITRVCNKDNRVDNLEYSCLNDTEFTTYIFPKILERFFTKNRNLSCRKLMGTDTSGTYYVERDDQLESFTVRNCDISMMDKIQQFERNTKFLEATPTFDTSISNYEEECYQRYISCNMALLYAKYRSYFLNREGKSDFFRFDTRRSFLDPENRGKEPNLKNLMILDVARYAYKLGFGNVLNTQYSVWDELATIYQDDSDLVSICNDFKHISYEEDSIYLKALVCADYERVNEGFFMENPSLAMETLEAAFSGVYDDSDSFLEYWNLRCHYYQFIGNDDLVKICKDIIFSRQLVLEEAEKKEEVIMGEKKESLISKIRKIKEERPDFATMIHEPIVTKEVSSHDEKFQSEDIEQLKLGAEEQAQRLMVVIKERDQIQKDAEEFAKAILKEQRERKKMVQDAEEQAKMLFKLQKENEALRALAEDNARSIFEQEQKYNEELRLREHVDQIPVRSTDIDRINALLNALSNVKELDFAVNHPTVMQEILLLEQKIITYLVTHKNIVPDSQLAKPVTVTESEERKTPIELLSIIENVYTNSSSYQSDGRHTLIHVSPTIDAKYRVTLYSVKNDFDDLLTEVYFDQDFFTEDVIRQICEIYRKDAVIVASKTDNIPNGLADYLVIDNRNNAIQFVGCKQDIINIAKAYL